MPNSSHPIGLTDVDGTVFFAAYDATHGLELWKSDGTADGTVLVKDINPGAENGIYDNPYAKPFMANVNGTLLFSANNGQHGFELWKSDGTVEGTLLVRDIQPGPNSSLDTYSNPWINVNGQLYFSADDGEHGKELWTSDGLGIGTQLFADIIPGPGGSNPRSLTSFGTSLYFPARADGFYELFKIDLSTLEPPRGDLTGDGKVRADDIDVLAAAIREGSTATRFDLNADNRVDEEDRRVLVEEAMKTWMGDADLDGQFTTQDLISVFQIGEYEDGVAGNSSWADGDWNGDGEFDSSDLVAAMQGAGYLQGRRG